MQYLLLLGTNEAPDRGRRAGVWPELRRFDFLFILSENIPRAVGTYVGALLLVESEVFLHRRRRKGVRDDAELPYYSWLHPIC